jgi:hypothetical protein
MMRGKFKSFADEIKTKAEAETVKPQEKETPITVKKPKKLKVEKVIKLKAKKK